MANVVIKAAIQWVRTSEYPHVHTLGGQSLSQLVKRDIKSSRTNRPPLDLLVMRYF